MEIRANSKDYAKLQKAYAKSDKINKELVKITPDERAEVPVIMVQNENKQLVQWTAGFNNVESFLEYGYVRIIKKCPFRSGRKCLGEKCQLYVIQNNTGDCAHVWSAVLHKEDN